MSILKLSKMQIWEKYIPDNDPDSFYIDCFDQDGNDAPTGDPEGAIEWVMEEIEELDGIPKSTYYLIETALYDCICHENVHEIIELNMEKPGICMNMVSIKDGFKCNADNTTFKEKCTPENTFCHMKPSNYNPKKEMY